MENADPRETKQIIHNWKDTDESYPKIYFSLNLSDYVKSCGNFCYKFWHFLRCPLTEYGHVT